MKLTRETKIEEIPVWQHDKASHHAQGGFNLDISGLDAGAIVPAGSVIGFDEATRIAKVLKSATVVANAGASATAYNVAKGHLFKVGDIVTVGGPARSITVIDKSNSAFDQVTVNATLGAAAEGIVIYAAQSEVASNPLLAVQPKGLSYKPLKVPVDDILFVDVVLRGTVYARRIPAVTDAVKAMLPNIIFSQSF